MKVDSSIIEKECTSISRLIREKKTQWTRGIYLAHFFDVFHEKVP